MDRREYTQKAISQIRKGLASYDDVKKLFDMLTKAIQAIQQDFANKSETQKAEITKQLTDTVSKAEKLVKSLDPKLSKLDSDLRSELRTTSRMFEQNLSDVRAELREEMTEEYDDEELRQELEAIKNSIPELPESFDPSDIMEDIEELKKRIVKVDRRIGSIQVPSPVNWPRHESFTMNGSDTSITLQAAVGAAGTAIFGVRYQGQTLDIDNQYTVNGNKISFTFTPANSTTISVSYYG